MLLIEKDSEKLSRLSLPVTAPINGLPFEMGTAMRLYGGVGLAAPQIGYLHRAILVEIGADENWKPVKYKLKGQASFIMQHEVDHLDGVTI